MANHNLIQCADHKWAPWSIICTHLMDGSSRVWLPLESSLPEVDHDWMCPVCIEGHDEEASADDSDTQHLHAICIHCVRSLRKRYDLCFEAN